MSNIIIRKLRKEDVQAVENIYRLYWSGEEFLGRLLARLNEAIEKTAESEEQKFEYIVAEENGEVVGVLGYRTAPEHMSKYAKTKTPAELYILAVKNKEKGIGKMLTMEALEETKNLGYTEVVLFSAESHKESWGFYDHLKFENVGPAVATNDEAGNMWRMEL